MVLNKRPAINNIKLETIFICSENRLRSPEADSVFSDYLGILVNEKTKTHNVILFVTYPSIAYYMVLACNEGGCSGISNQVTGVYINGCQ